MIIRLRNRAFDFSVDAPPSKSVFHRELIVRFLNGYEDDLAVTSGDSKDIAATKNCLQALRDRSLVLDCNESGSTLRFMIPVAAAYLKANNITGKVVFKTAGRLYDRPLDDLESCLMDHGVTLVRDDSTRTISLAGELMEGVFTIDGSVSSQYVSGIMMALIVLPGSSVNVVGTPSSVHYIELTQAVIDKYKNARHEDFLVEGDWSGGAFLLCLKERINGNIRVGNLNRDSVQGDKAIEDYLAACGADEFTWDCRDIPDIVPYMAVTAAFKNKKTVFGNIGRLRIKESDRVAAIREQLAAAGIKTEETEETLTVYGYGGTFTNDMITLKSYNDHRMVMSAILIAAALGTDLEIDTDAPLDKSFPGFRNIIREEFS